MTSDLLKNIEFIDILCHRKADAKKNTLSIYNFINTEELKPYLTPSQSHFFSLGQHPWYLNSYSHGIERWLTYFENEYCLAIGETGIDKLKKQVALHTQISSFKEHISYSERLRLPLIIHCVKSYNEILEIHKELKPKSPWIIHNFNHNESFINEISDLNIYYSLGQNFFKRENSKINKFLRSLDPKKIFFETDEMDEDISKLYSKFSKEFNINMAMLSEQIKNNFKDVFLQNR